MGIDLKKEIKLSELFRRSRAEPSDPGAREQPPVEKKGRARRSFGRKQEQPKLGLGGVSNGSPALPQVPLMRAFNLLPREEYGDRAEGRPALAHVLLALAGLVMVAGLGSYYMFTTGGLADKQDQRNELRVKLSELAVPREPSGEDAKSSLAAEQGARQNALAGALAARTAWDRLLRELSLVLPPDVWLTSLAAKSPTANASSSTPAAQPGGSSPSGAASQFTLGGYARRQEGVARLLARLDTLPELASVQLVSATTSEVEGREVIQFQIGAALVPGAAQ
jgi:Tfp pilus assembly protein PilN